ncbi:TPA: hypothetical protein ACH3X1_000374 [Trebouxia sp. C0004]
MDLSALRQEILLSNKTASEKAEAFLLKSKVNDLSKDEWRNFIAGIPEDVEKEIGMLKSAGTASTPIDSSLTVADQLFAPFSEDLFSAELDIHALQNMLTQPLTTQVPVASNIFTQYCSLMPPLYRSSTTENARGLISRFDAALAQTWPTGSGSELNYTGFWDFLGFKLPEFAQQYIDCGVSCSRGVEDESITSPKGKRDYICLVDNMLIIAGEDKTSKTQMAEADNDLIKKHVGSNRAMYGRLQYIVLVGTAGPDLKFNVTSVVPGSGLQELFPAMEVASPVNRQKALSMFINLVRWVRTVHDQRLLPKHRHSLFKSMPRPSPYPGECDLLCNGSVTTGDACNVTCCDAAAPHTVRPLQMSCLAPSCCKMGSLEELM